MTHQFKVGDKAKIKGQTPSCMPHNFPMGCRVTIIQTEGYINCAKVYNKGRHIMRVVSFEDLEPITEPQNTKQ